MEREKKGGRGKEEGGRRDFLPRQMTEASSLVQKLLALDKGQLISSVSLPVHSTLCKRVLPSPGPNASGEPTADATEKEEDKVNCLDMMNTSSRASYMYVCAKFAWFQPSTLHVLICS